LLALQAHIEECQRLALAMRNALDEWADQPECAPDGQAICRLIEDVEPPSHALFGPLTI
jgi:hypothetical protein